MSGRWHEHIENGEPEFRRSFGGESLVIRPHIADAWICELPNGNRIIGQLPDVQWTVEVTLKV